MTTNWDSEQGWQGPQGALPPLDPVRPDQPDPHAVGPSGLLRITEERLRAIGMDPYQVAERNRRLARKKGGVGKAAVGKHNSAGAWDSVLNEIQRSSYRAAWLDAEIEGVRAIKAEMESHAEGLEDWIRIYERMFEVLLPWMEMSLKERKHLVQTSNRAISLGLSHQVVQTVELQGRTIAQVLGSALDALGLDEQQRQVAAQALRQALEQASAQGHRVVGAPPAPQLQPAAGPPLVVFPKPSDYTSGSAPTGPTPPPG